MNAACFVPMILANAARAQAERERIQTGSEHTPPAPPPKPKTDAAPKREGKVDRRG